MAEKLAKRAVIGGKVVSLPSSLDGVPQVSTAAFFWNAVSRLGVRRTAEKILAKEALGFEDIEDLLAVVPLSILMKLVSLRSETIGEVASAPKLPLPALFLPVIRYSESRSPLELKEMLREVLAPLEGEPFEAYLDNPRSAQEWKRYFAIVEWLPELSRSIRVVAPSVSEMVGGPSEHLLTRKVYSTHKIVERLNRLREIGVTRLRSAQTLCDAEVMHRSGFAVSVSHTIEAHFGARRIAHELVRLNEFSRTVAPVQSWVPGFSRAQLRGQSPSVRDLTLLRVLAVGSVALTEVKYRRASNRHFSPFGLALAKMCGANDFGFAARDPFTASELDFLDMKEVLTAVHGTVAA
ncbi:MAG: hypothetical protein KDD64_11200 [Bdellovibrionales bacterium]|nr:hypothetical protein [Bdellovibrionales bacterium]